MQPLSQYNINIEAQVRNALEEDLGGSLTPENDITACLIAANTDMQAKIITREDCVVCGTAWVQTSFDLLGECKLTWLVADGDHIKAGDTLVVIDGNARNILTAERTALNFLQTLSGTASLAYQYSQHLSGSRTNLLDTRKTIPGFMQAQKYAVNCGGGQNHRMGLYDAFLIKENHIAACGGIQHAVAAARKLAPQRPIEVEVENLDELQQAIDASVNTIMLDNFSTELIIKAVAINQHRCKLEVSGNITSERLKELATTGVDYVSSGALTKNVRAIDLSLISQ